MCNPRVSKHVASCLSSSKNDACEQRPAALIIYSAHKPSAPASPITDLARPPPLVLRRCTAGAFAANKYAEYSNGSSTNVALSIVHKELVILGTQYAGEMKKGVFT